MWKLATTAVDGQNRVGLLVDGRLADLEYLGLHKSGPSHEGRLTMLALLDDWAAWHSFIESWAGRIPSEPAYWLSADARLQAPVLYPRKLLMAGANYSDHAKEMAERQGQKWQPPDKSVRKPFFFLKAPTTTIVAPDAPICLPEDSKAVDWEVELAVVMGKHAKNVSVDQAADYIAGYTICNDVSARDTMWRKDWEGDKAFEIDWVWSKSFDTFAPMGPYITPRSAIKDVYNLRLTLSVNGEVKQNSNSGNLIFNCEEQIAFLSRIVTLEPGDVISTGTPSGVGAPKGTFLKRGDVVVAAIDEIGELRNVCE
jgi:2-keto-4-pentenoate hydratase/2-oxohepta-3-ene-1,7-dioic acid hydratase in catechol pathway